MSLEATDDMRAVVNGAAQARAEADQYLAANPGFTPGEAWEGPDRVANDNDAPIGEQPTIEPLSILTIGELVSTYPKMHSPLIEGLLRERETMNVIAASKIGKSWLSYSLAYAVATGGLWLDIYQCTRGDVLLIDNELHPETSAHRLPRVAGAMNLSWEQVAGAVSIINLRGRLKDLRQLGAELLKIPLGRFKLIIIDAMYRAMPLGTDENDNASMAAIYNMLDHYAEAIGAAFVLIHHASKGDQSGKSVTDVGSGAGAQSRATDTHLILRPHEEDGVVVLDAAVRSWPPVAPICLRWDFPVWRPASELDPTKLRKSTARKKNSDETPSSTEPPWDAKRFAGAFGRPEPKARSVVLDEARLVGLSDRKAEGLLKAAVDRAYLFAWKEAGANSRTLVALEKPVEPAPAAPAPNDSDAAAAEKVDKRKSRKRRGAKA